MEFIIVLLVIGIIYFLFIKKGSGGKSFHKNRKEIHKTVEQEGGMYELYKDFVDYFKEQDFQIREINDDSLYLHYGTSVGKVGIQIIQTAPRKAEILMGCEMRSGKSHEATIKVNTHENQNAMVDRLIEKFSDGQLSDFKNVGIKFNKSASSRNSKQNPKSSMSVDNADNSEDLIEIKEYYENLLQEKDLPDSLKTIVNDFFIPDRVNPEIYDANNEKIINGTMFKEVSNDEKLVSPKLKEYSDANGTIPRGIPSWFVAAYPDVTVWFARDGGIKEIEKKFDNMNKSELIEDDLIKKEILRKVITLYKEKVNNKLETARPPHFHY
ncbi:hypothetical protein [Fodinibius halophilus]|uniref:Uncharacterized protein n=1 Tax=Fodinibius halophilus TaxID=1736908 RepID=A0A6M1T9R1_9BACT|nr:hypothetical protein [Fodinibius halophilus]NGP90225.1 hypothetical protein [Fodinibius halophilus]